jgi:5-methylcytosine-specific restriction endonuclease McrA
MSKKSNKSKRGNRRLRLYKRSIIVVDKVEYVPCFYCDSKILPRKITFEHIVPKCKGGNWRDENTIPACRSCNTNRSKKYYAKWFDELRELGISENRIQIYSLFANNKVPREHRGFEIENDNGNNPLTSEQPSI